MDARYDLAYREALRSIQDQREGLDSLQTRAGIVGSAAAVVLSLIAGRLSSHSSLALQLSLAGYLGIAALVAFILWPRRKWRSHFEISALHWNYIEGPQPATADIMTRDLSLFLDAYVKENAGKIDLMGWALTAAIVLLLACGAGLVYDLLGG